MFDFKYPKSLEDYSFEFGLVYLHVGITFILLILSELLPYKIQVGFIVVYFICIFVVLYNHRRRNKWHWPGVRKQKIFNAFLALLFGVIFIIATTTGASKSFRISWSVGIMGMAVFNALLELKIFFMSKTEFLSQCRVNKIEQAESSNEPKWKNIVRTIFVIYFTTVWLLGAGFFWKQGKALKAGNSQPTLERIVSINNHGHKVYITPEEKRVINILKISWFVGTFSVLPAFVIVQLILGVKIIPLNSIG